MRQARLRWLLLLGVLQPGCSFYYYAAQNLVEGPIEFRDREVDRCRFRQVAEDAWAKLVADQPPLAYAYHYGSGFRAGYADYLDNNGTGQPPAAPPFVYRSVPFETPEGRKDVEDWYAGFRQGAAAARASGYRDAAIILPLGLPPSTGYETRRSSPSPAPSPTTPATPAPLTDEILPPARKRHRRLMSGPATTASRNGTVGSELMSIFIGEHWMQTPAANAPRAAVGGKAAGLVVGLTVALLSAGLSGCAAVTNPVADGVPVDRVPPEYFPRPKEDEKTIPLTLLRQKKPEAYLLDAGDVLGVYIEGILGDKTQPPPAHYSELANVPPALGYPIPVREDGKVPLPLVGPILVRGLTIPEAERRIIMAYTEDKKILQPDRARIIITLVKPREYSVLVVRQDSGGVTLGPAGTLGNTKRGTGALVELPAYENDVLNALTRTGGLPGLDAMNEVVIQRGGAGNGANASGPYPPQSCPPGGGGMAGANADAGQMIRIPLRMPPDEPPPFTPQDVILQTGDIVFIEARDTEVFYVGGILLPRQFVLPRDYDLRMVDAVALAGGPLVNGNQTQNNLSGQIVESGLGSPSPSLLTVLRKTKYQGQLTIRVDLNRALRDPRENILVQPGDVLILQETPGEAITRYLSTVIRFNYLATLINRPGLQATSSANLP